MLIIFKIIPTTNFLINNIPLPICFFNWWKHFFYSCCCLCSKSTVYSNSVKKCNFEKSLKLIRFPIKFLSQINTKYIGPSSLCTILPILVSCQIVQSWGFEKVDDMIFFISQLLDNIFWLFFHLSRLSFNYQIMKNFALRLEMDIFKDKWPLFKVNLNF